jgi:hypothetical protein
LYLALSLLLFPPWWKGLLVFISLPLSGLFAWSYYLLFKRITGGFRIRKFIGNKDRDLQQLLDNHSELVNLIKEYKVNEKQ